MWGVWGAKPPTRFFFVHFFLCERKKWPDFAKQNWMRPAFGEAKLDERACFAAEFSCSRYFVIKSPILLTK